MAESSNNFLGSLGSGLAMGAASGLVGQMFSGLSAARQWKYQRKAMALQQQYALEQMQKQYEYQRSQFDYENEYNSPVNMFERYRLAGINPSAVLGSSGASMSGTMPMPGAPSGSSVSPGSPVTPAPNPNVAQDALAASQVSVNEAMGDKLSSEASLNRSKVPTEEALRLFYSSSSDNVEAQRLRTLTENSIAQLKLARTSEQLDAEINNIMANTDLMITQQKLSAEQASFYRASALESVKRAVIYKPQSEYLEALRVNVNGQTRYVSLLADDLDATIEACRDFSDTIPVTTFYEDEDGNLQREVVSYEVNGYQARELGAVYGSMAGLNNYFTGFIDTHWRNTEHWNREIRGYVDTAVGAVGTVGSIITKAKAAGAYVRATDIAEDRLNLDRSKFDYDRQHTMTFENKSYYDAEGALRGFTTQKKGRY